MPAHFKKLIMIKGRGEERKEPHTMSCAVAQERRGDAVKDRTFHIKRSSKQEEYDFTTIFI